MADLLPLTLAPHDGPAVPCGLVIARAGAAEFLLRLELRLPHYRGLRLAATKDSLILIAAEGEPLPWVPVVQHYLRRQGPAFLPVGLRLDVPARWHDIVVERLVALRALAMPVLMLPDAVSPGVAVASLADASPAGDIDLPRLAGECLA